MAVVVAYPNFIAQRMEVTTQGDYGMATPGGVATLFARQRLASDPIGGTTVTFKGVVATSEVRVFLSDGTEVAGVESCAANQILTWAAYAPGSAFNNVTIRIVHSQYKIKEFAYTTEPGAQSIPVQQERDKWYSNPA